MIFEGYTPITATKTFLFRIQINVFADMTFLPLLVTFLTKLKSAFTNYMLASFIFLDIVFAFMTLDQA